MPIVHFVVEVRAREHPRLPDGPAADATRALIDLLWTKLLLLSSSMNKSRSPPLRPFAAGIRRGSTSQPVDHRGSRAGERHLRIAGARANPRSARTCRA